MTYVIQLLQALMGAPLLPTSAGVTMRPCAHIQLIGVWVIGTIKEVLVCMQAYACARHPVTEGHRSSDRRSLGP